MTAAMDVAYLDVPYVARAERVELMMRMSPACWEDACHDCTVPGCICAHHDEPPPRVLSADAELAARIWRLAGSIGSAA